jgi:hypothetical protein
MTTVVKTNSSGYSVTPGVDNIFEFKTNDILALTINASQVVSLVNPLPVNSGGIGFAAPGMVGNILRSNGTIWESVAPTPTITDDTTTNVLQYLGMSRATSGAWITDYICTSKLNFNPFTGVLTSFLFNASSDVTLKENITPIVNGLSTIESLNGVSFNWKDSQLPSIGLIAQEVEKVCPILVSEEDGLKSLNYNGIIGLLVEAVKELSARVKELENG